MSLAWQQPRFAFVATLVAVVLLGLTFSVSGSRGGADIRLDKTVGVGGCTDDNDITVLAGTTVTYCYAVENRGTQTFTAHTLVDDQLGTLLSDFPHVLAPDATFAVSYTAQVLETTVNVAIWTAFGVPADAADDDSATVTVAAPAIELIKTVGTAPAVCATETSIALEQPGEVTYCYEARNTGNVTFSLHDLLDDQLGLLLDGHVEDLLPGQFLRVITDPVTISATTVNSATWTARDPFFAESNAMATVTVGLIFTDGFESGDTTAWQ